MDNFLVFDVVNSFENFVYYVYIQLCVFNHLKQEFVSNTLDVVFDILVRLAVIIQTQTKFAEVSVD